jgi:hypothetical protein
MLNKSNFFFGKYVEPVGELETGKSLLNQGACRTRRNPQDFLPMENKKKKINIRNKKQTL